MAGADTLLAQLQAQRLHWVPAVADQVDGVAVQMDTPSQYAAMAMVQQMRGGSGDELITLLCAQVRGWRNVPQSLLLGAAVGSGDPAPFDARLLHVLLQDRPDWVLHLALQAVELARQARERVQGASGN